jgi:hypothetical protein
VFRTKLRFDERVDPSRESDLLTEKARLSGLSEVAISEMRASFEPLLTELVATGKLLKPQGSQMVVDRKIYGRGYSVSFHFGVNEKPSFLERLLRLMGVK